MLKNVAMYGVHITVWHSLFMYFVSQCIHALSYPYIG